MSSHNSFIYVGQFIQSSTATELQYIDKGVLVVADNVVAALESNTDNLDKLQIQFQIADNKVYQLTKEQFVIPGLIDTHIHGPQYPNRGIGTDLPLLEWLSTYTFPLEARFSDPSFAEKVYQTIVRQTLSSGTTTACYFATVHANTAVILADAAVNQNQRAFVGKVNMNANSPPELDESLGETILGTESFLAAMRNKGIVRPIITPRFAISCDMPAMKKLGQLAAQHDVHIQTHISENKDEVAAVADIFQNCPNYASVYDKAGLLTPKTILAHGVYLTDEEVALLVKRETSISHCPNSNNTLQSGLCPVRRLLNAGLKVGLGTDCAGGYSTTVLDAMRQALQTSISVAFANPSLSRLTIPEVFFMATLGGARALAIGDITGDFQNGKAFDALVVDMSTNPAIDFIQDLNLEQLFQKFIYLADDRNIVKVYVNGSLSVAKS